MHLSLGIDEQKVSDVSFMSSAEYVLSRRRRTLTNQEVTVVEQQIITLDASQSAIIHSNNDNNKN